MSIDAFNRAMVRELAAWKPFTSNNLFLNADDRVERAIILGLYAGVYKYGHDYLEVVEAEQLQAVIDEFTQNMAQLSNESAKLVLEMAAKRYLASIDQQIFDEKILTKQGALDAENQKWDSRIAALSADREALETLRQRTVLSEAQAVNRVNEISAQVLNEQYTQSELDNEELKQRLEVSKAELRILQSANRGLEIQGQINNAAFQLFAVDADIAGLNAQVAGTLADIARNQRSEEELEIERQKNSNLEYEIEEETEAKLAGILSHRRLIQDEIDAMTDFERQEIREQAEKLDGLNVDHTLKQKNIELSQEESLFRALMRVRAHANDIPFVTQNKQTTEKKDADETILIKNRIWAKDRVVDASIEAAQFIADANIATSLLHKIGSE
ncbi:MAG: hypothetical protein KKF30_10445 [Proteobacteria bacterium]|nr:hypothetical protein [Pseudomonadota bacterium]MBU4470312.1 hypothetical protein [Pseudomonadota bacterium]MCG2752724.1 hypothetical protein [Desulfobacteraceae bacterium]